MSSQDGTGGGAVTDTAGACCRALFLFAVILIGLTPEPAWAATEVYESPRAAALPDLQEPPALAAAVADGSLPALAKRLPKFPLVVSLGDGKTPGKSGGQIRTIVSKTREVRMLVVYGYSRLVAFNEELELVPDILERVKVEDGRVFTLTLRQGHRWSNGDPFTSEDFRYYWVEVANNEALSPTGPPVDLWVDNEPATFEVIDEVTVRYSWPSPNPFFLRSLAGARPLLIYRPDEYMRQFHERFGDKDFIAEKVEMTSSRNWAQLHNKMDNLYKFDNPDLPTLQPWYNTVRPPTKRFIAKRNPYFHRIDEQGQQLPYIDQVTLNVSGAALVPAKTGAGEADLQSRGLNFSDYTFLKENEERSGYDVRLWRTVRGSQLALYPNMNANDEVWRTLNRDVRFRRALSLAIDRGEINQVIYYGLCLEGNNTVLPDSPLYSDENFDAWTEFDPDQANELLDEIGLTERDSEDVRLMPDGRPLEIIVETAGESTEEPDVLELISDTWRQIGVKLFIKPSSRDALRPRIFSGDTVMSVWPGVENGIPSADISPEAFVPIHQHQYQWSKWGNYAETHGKAGEAVDMELPLELMRQQEVWRQAKDADEREAAWQRILEIHADQVYTIGTVAQVPQPIVVSKALQNVPEEAMYNWDPGALFGIYRPDTFWLKQ